MDVRGVARGVEWRTIEQFCQMMIIVGTVVTVTKMSQEHGKRPWNWRWKELV